MNIFIPFKIKDIGGTPTFVKKFSQGLIEQGWQVTLSFESSFDIMFVIADCPLRYALYAKLTGKTIVQRLDGVWHRATPAGRLYPLYNLKMRLIHNFFADFVVYQSEFSQACVEKFLGKKKKNSITIYNGIDLNQYTKPVSRELSKKIHLVTSGVFRKHGHIAPLIKAARLLPPDRFDFTIIGSYTKEAQKFFDSIKNSKNIHFAGPLSHDELLKELGRYDIFLFSDQSACPNSVLEALGAGLPVVAYDRGSIRELIVPGESGEITPLPEHNPFVNWYPFQKDSYEAFSEDIQKVAKDLPKYQDAARKQAEERFDLQKMLDCYVQVIRKMKNSL